MIKPNLSNAALETVAGNEKQFPNNSIPQIALSGRSNVGKSSLINTLLGRRRLAYTSSSPGKTITVNFYNVDNKLYFVDLPGYGYASRPKSDKEKWSALTDGYITSGKPAAIIQLVDIKAGATKDDLLMLDYLSRAETASGEKITFFIVATKADKLNKTELAKALAELHALPLPENTVIVPFSALTGNGKDEVWKAIYNCLQ